MNRLESPGNFVRVFRGKGFRFFVTAGNVDNSQRIFVSLPAKLVMGKKKEGPPDGPSWASSHQISAEERIAVQEDISAKWPACKATV